VGSCIKLLSLIDLRSFELSGDKLIDQTAQIIRSEVRGEDIAARIGGDEFSVLGIHCNAGQIQTLAERLTYSLETAGIETSIGYAVRHPSEGLITASQKADQKMYECKLKKKSPSRIHEFQSN
jgi:diguanylate cyclase (GGDEF)-like protein